MVKVKPGAKVITIVPAQDAYGNISIVKPGSKVITIEPSADALSMEESTQSLNREFVSHLRRFPEWLKR
jgi:hypothetical protein